MVADASPTFGSLSMKLAILSAVNGTASALESLEPKWGHSLRGKLHDDQIHQNHHGEKKRRKKKRDTLLPTRMRVLLSGMRLDQVSLAS
jgi:hypothetical protein